MAMKIFRTKHDWLNQIKSDLQSCDIQHSEAEIKAMSRYKFKTLVNKEIKENLCCISVNAQYLYQGQLMQECLCTYKLTTREKTTVIQTQITPNEAKFQEKYENGLGCILWVI